MCQTFQTKNSFSADFKQKIRNLIATNSLQIDHNIQKFRWDYDSTLFQLTKVVEWCAEGLELQNLETIANHIFTSMQRESKISTDR